MVEKNELIKKLGVKAKQVCSQDCVCCLCSPTVILAAKKYCINKLKPKKTN